MHVDIRSDKWQSGGYATCGESLSLLMLSMSLALLALSNLMTLNWA